MLPLVWAASKNQCILLPYTATRQIKACCRKCLTEVQSLSVSMENINGSILFHRLFHIYKRCKEEIIKILISHIVIFDFSGGLLNIDIVWRIRQNHICFLAIHQNIINLRQCAISATNSVSAKKPHITRFCNRGFGKLLLHIEIILCDVLIMHAVKKLLDFRRIKTCKCNIKVA